MFGNVNVKDLLFKMFWTGVAAALALAISVVTGIEGEGWVALAMPFLTLALAFARQQTGETPPDLNPK